MRQMTQFLLSTCAVCAVGQLARANTNQPEPAPAQQTPPSSPQSPTPATPPPVPTDTPAGTSPADPTSTSPSDPSNGPYNSPTTPTDRPTDTAPGTTSPPPSAPDTSGSGGVSGGASVQGGATVEGGAGVHGGVSAGAGATIQGGATVQGGAAVQGGTAVDGGATVIAPVVETDDDPYSYAWREPGLQSGIGVSTIIGGGVTGFTDKTMRNTTSDVGGLWDFRLTIGSHVPIALDLSYVGSATNINGLPTGRKGTLVGTTAEAALRYNLLPHFPWTPYIFAGVGWQRYDVTQTNVSLSDSGMNDHDNLLEFPVGGGLAYRMAGFVFDLRGTFRATTDQDLVLTRPVLASSPTSDDFAAMHTWEASAALGYEF